MTTRQKTVLIIFGVLDLIVVAGLGAVVLSSGLSGSPSAATVEQDPCTVVLLDALTSAGDVATVAWSQPNARVEVAPGPTRAEGLGPQYLWTVLDAFPTPLPAPCDVPNSVTISVRTPGGQAYVMHLAGSDLVGWLEGTIADADLAARAGYRSLPSR